MRTSAPVATSAFSNWISSFVSSFTTRSCGSSDITFVPVISSTPFSPYHSGGCTYASSTELSPRMYSFDSGGRSYGGCGSRPPPPAGAKQSLHALPHAGVEPRDHLAPRLEHRVGPRHEPLPLAQHRYQQRALRHLEIPDPATGDARVGSEQHLDDLQPLLRQVEQVHEPVLGHLVLDQAQDQVGGRDEGADPEQVEPLPVPRVVHPGDDPV